MDECKVHQFVAELEYSALAWSNLAWSWGMSFFGMAPQYKEYMQGDELEIDSKFFGSELNDEINRIPGYEQHLTIRQKFERAVDYYEYCYVQAHQASLNPPWDLPPDIKTLYLFKIQNEVKPQAPDQIIKASAKDALENNADFQALWQAGGMIMQEDRAAQYTESNKVAAKYVFNHLAPRQQLTLDQLNKDTGFLDSGSVTLAAGVHPEDMDEVMPEERQWEKLGDVYVQKTPERNILVAYGIAGRYYKAGHNIERLMQDDEGKRQFSGLHYLIIHTWNQIMRKINECK